MSLSSLPVLYITSKIITWKKYDDIPEGLQKSPVPNTNYTVLYSEKEEESFKGDIYVVKEEQKPIEPKELINLLKILKLKNN